MKDLPQPQPGILDIALYVSGEAGLPGHEQVLKLSANENPHGPSPKARAAFAAAAAQLHRYPATDHAALRRAIAEVHGLDPELIICGVGSDEVLQFVAQGFAGPGDEVIVTEHGFSMYPILARAAGATPVTVPERARRIDVDAILAAVTDRTRIVFIANPANPSGTMLTEAGCDRLAAGLPGHVVRVHDGAYAECVPGFDGGAGLVAAFPNVVMTRTLSKIHGLGGLRVGWGHAQRPVIEVLNRLRQQALRAIAVPGSDPTVGYWEWSAADGCDLDDPAAWSQANPALGHTITADTLAARIRSDPPQVVRTELLCQWVDTMDSPWPPNAWAACTTDGLELQADRDTVLALDVSPDRRTAALVAVQAAEDGDQLDAVLVDTWHADGAVDDLTIATAVAEVAEQLDARLVAYDRYTASAVAQRLQRAGVAVAEVSGPLFVQACDQLLTAMVTGRLRHPGQAALTDHVLAAARKPAADGGWRIVRARSAGPIPAAVALAMAVHHALDGGGAEPVVMFA